MTLNLGYLAQQLVMLLGSGLAAACGWLCLRWLRRRGLWRAPLAWSLLLELPLFAGVLFSAGGYVAQRGWLDALLPGRVLPLFIGVALAFYWLAVWWPLRVWLCWRQLAGQRFGRLVRTAAILGPALALHATCVEPLLLEAERVTLRAADVRGGEVRVAHLSDLQLVDFGPREAAVITAVNAFRPHLVVMTGDYITASGGEATAIAAARRVLGALQPSHGLFATTSDSDDEAQRRQIFAGLPVRYLVNRSEAVAVAGTMVRVCGVFHPYPQWHLLRRHTAPAELTLVACHTPDLADDARLELPAADFFLCGHTHGGQLQVPFFGPLVTLTRRTPRAVAAGGVFPRPDGMTVVLSRGIGMEGQYAPRFRLNCRPHLFLLTFQTDKP